MDCVHTYTHTHTTTECLQAFHMRVPSLPTGPGSGVPAGQPWGVDMTETFTAKARRLDRILRTGRRQCSDPASGCCLLSQASGLPRQLVSHVENPWAGVEASCSSVSVLSLWSGAPGALTPAFPQQPLPFPAKPACAEPGQQRGRKPLEERAGGADWRAGAAGSGSRLDETARCCVSTSTREESYLGR